MDLMQLNKYLPLSTVQQIMLLFFKEMFETIPFLREKDNKCLIMLAEQLESQMYQPLDYIVT